MLEAIMSLRERLNAARAKEFYYQELAGKAARDAQFAEQRYSRVCNIVRELEKELNAAKDAENPRKNFIRWFQR